MAGRIFVCHSSDEGCSALRFCSGTSLKIHCFVCTCAVDWKKGLDERNKLVMSFLDIFR